MATRAAIITIDDRMMYLTYNHYDGYPEYLGKALETHYNTEELASKISREGYISYLDDETGEVNVTNPQDKDVKPTTYDLGGQDIDGMAYILAKEINASGADYAYIWNQRGDNWVTIKNDGIKSTMDKLENELPTMGFDAEQDNFTNEGVEDMDKVLSQAMFKLQDEPKEMLDAYKKSLANDIRLNGPESYADYSVEDFIEDYENYIGDKMSMEESFINKMKHRAGIIK